MQGKISSSIGFDASVFIQSERFKTLHPAGVG